MRYSAYGRMRVMSKEKRCCTAVSEIGFHCTREEGHDGPSDPSPYKDENPKHIARNAEDVIVQIWHEHAEADSPSVMKAGN